MEFNKLNLDLKILYKIGSELSLKSGKSLNINYKKFVKHKFNLKIT
jgi:hypothetical protein